MSPKQPRRSGSAVPADAEDLAPRPGKANPAPGRSYAGVFQGIARGGGFVVLEERGLADVFVPESGAGPALHGDEVIVRILRLRPGRAPEAEVERVTRRANKQIIGRLIRAGRVSIVAPKNPRIGRNVEIHRQFTREEVPEDAWVNVEVTRWPAGPGQPLVGRLLEVLGVESDPRLPVLLLIREGGIVPEFPEEVEREAAELERRGIEPDEIARRRDFRGRPVVTIDPATAKDFDDAVSIEARLENGWRVAVHIADVAHYVRPGGKIDAEGYDRATSIYPIDRVVPMLPETLSNGLCSLKPGEDKLVMTAIFTVTRSGEVKDPELCEGIMHSVRRFAYEEVQALFDEADGAETRFPRPAVAETVREELFELRAASSALLAKRMRRGSLDLDLPETEILFGPGGQVADLRRKERLESHRLIEDLMIAANEAVAETLAARGVPLLYRVHEEPSAEKLLQLGPALARFGIHLPSAGGVPQAAIQAAVEKAQQHPAGRIVQSLVLRSLPRAVYQPENLGHYGLASRCYAHFTSPIRRYPDLIVHRAVKALLAGGRAREEYETAAAAQLPDWGRHASAREERAQRIEWDAQKALAFEFMKRFIGDIFEGFIGGVTAKGFFVELAEYPVEGFVPIRSLEGDFYEFDDRRLAYHGRRTGESFALGDKVSVQIQRIDVLAGQMDLQLIRAEAPPRKGPRGGKSRPWTPPKRKGGRQKQASPKRGGKRRGR